MFSYSSMEMYPTILPYECCTILILGVNVIEIVKTSTNILMCIYYFDIVVIYKA